MKKVLLLTILLTGSFAQAQEQNQPRLVLEGTIEFYGEITADTCAPETHHIQKSALSAETIKAQYRDCALPSSGFTKQLSNVKVSPITQNIESSEHKNYAFYMSEFI